MENLGNPSPTMDGENQSIIQQHQQQFVRYEKKKKFNDLTKCCNKQMSLRVDDPYARGIDYA